MTRWTALVYGLEASEVLRTAMRNQMLTRNCTDLSLRMGYYRSPTWCEIVSPGNRSLRQRISPLVERLRKARLMLAWCTALCPLMLPNEIQTDAVLELRFPKTSSAAPTTAESTEAKVGSSGQDILRHQNCFRPEVQVCSFWFHSWLCLYSLFFVQAPTAKSTWLMFASSALYLDETDLIWRLVWCSQAVHQSRGFGHVATGTRHVATRTRLACSSSDHFAGCHDTICDFAFLNDCMV